MPRKILVFGSNSFSGSDFIDLLLDDKSNDIVGISRSEEKSDLFLSYKRHKSPLFKFFQMDLNKDMPAIHKLLDEFKPEFIVNFAAQSEVGPSWQNPWHWFQTNVVSLSHLTHHLKSVKYLKRYVHISSPEVYGTCEGFIKEDAPMNPSTPYAASKAAADLHLSTLAKNYNFPLVTIRSTNVYGAHQQLFKIIPRTVICIKSGKKVELHGGGKAVKSYIHIRDVSRGELDAMEKGNPGEIYHLSPTRGISVRDVVRTICEVMKVDFSKATENVEERLGQDKVYTIDSSKARNQFGWHPQVSFSEGAHQVIQWVEKNWDVIKNLPTEYIHKA